MAVEPEHPFCRSELRLRLGEEPGAVARVPAPRDLAHQLQVLELVLTHGNERCPVQEHVGRLQHGIVQQARRHALLALRLVLELRLALELAERRDGVEQPVQLSMLGHVGLHEHDAPLRVESRGQEADRHVERALPQGRHVVRLGDGVQVHDTEQALVLVLQPDPVLHRTEIVADVQLARGLNAGEHARHGLTSYGRERGHRKVRNLKDLVDVARGAAARAATHLRGLEPPEPADWTEKARHDFVTEADRSAERLIAETLTASVPGSSVVGEELTPDGTHAGEIVWIVDPLDGTTNFLHRYPQYAVSVGCVVRGELCVGVVHDVARDIVYWAASGHGAWQGERRLRVSGLTEPRHALVGTGFPFKQLPVPRRYLDQFAAVMGASSGIRRAGSAALAPWDVAAGVVLVREAGGVVTTLDGSADVLGHGSIVAGNPVLHRWLLDLVRAA